MHSDTARFDYSPSTIICNNGRALLARMLEVVAVWGFY